MLCGKTGDEWQGLRAYELGRATRVRMRERESRREWPKTRDERG